MLIDEDGNVLEENRFNRTVIKSKARFTYEQAQKIIDKKISSQSEIDPGFGCINDKDDKKIFEDIQIMNNLAIIMRKKRIENGSLTFETPKQSFSLNENSYPTKYYLEERSESNFLVEEYMLLANQKVG
eukprot:GHVR01107601.1.p1 GENE.GHVR01107601.1~~GHVR01107601.1.p1  ORF type:complete len:129 (+),score=10.93 GHVR01107601.1:3051-3437(+)